MQPKKLTGLEISFSTDVEALMPKKSDIPEEFTRDRNPYVSLVNTWFYSGLSTSAIKQKAGINRNDALGHLKAIMGSWEPKHEHKIAAVAYLMSQWFDLANQEDQ